MGTPLLLKLSTSKMKVSFGFTTIGATNPSPPAPSVASVAPIPTPVAVLPAAYEQATGDPKALQS